MDRIVMNLKKSEDAISPVIGVMMMLAVTLIIAVVVVTISTGLATDTQSAPNAVLEVTIDRCTVGLGSSFDMNYDDEITELEGALFGPELAITHISGDELNTKDLELHFSWEHIDENGKLCFHSSVYSAEKFSSEYPGGMTYYYRDQPLYMKRPGGAGSQNLDNYFGANGAILRPGMKVFTTTEFLQAHECAWWEWCDYGDFTDPGINHGSPYMDAVLNNGKWDETTYPNEASINSNKHSEYLYNGEWISGFEGYIGGIMDHLPEGTAVDVKIIHLPSNKPIHNKVTYVIESFRFEPSDEGEEW